jgi:hypothetical protein
MTGQSERPSRLPREKRKASQTSKTDRAPSSYRQERAALVMLYASKIAAARLYAPKHELDAIIAAIRAEEKAALAALREREQIRINRQRQNRIAWQFAGRALALYQNSRDPARPRIRRLVYKRHKHLN